jgi:hypothetical protein
MAVAGLGEDELLEIRSIRNSEKNEESAVVALYRSGPQIADGDNTEGDADGLGGGDDPKLRLLALKFGGGSGDGVHAGLRAWSLNQDLVNDKLKEVTPRELASRVRRALAAPSPSGPSGSHEGLRDGGDSAAPPLVASFTTKSKQPNDLFLNITQESRDGIKLKLVKDACAVAVQPADAASIAEQLVKAAACRIGALESQLAASRDECEKLRHQCDNYEQVTKIAADEKAQLENALFSNFVQAGSSARGYRACSTWWVWRGVGGLQGGSALARALE